MFLRHRNGVNNMLNTHIPRGSKLLKRGETGFMERESLRAGFLGSCGAPFAWSFDTSSRRSSVVFWLSLEAHVDAGDDASSTRGGREEAISIADCGTFRTPYKQRYDWEKHLYTPLTSFAQSSSSVFFQAVIFICIIYLSVGNEERSSREFLFVFEEERSPGVLLRRIQKVQTLTEQYVPLLSCEAQWYGNGMSCSSWKISI